MFYINAMTQTPDSPKPFLQALAGQKLTTPPFWFMRQAGRYLPEYRALRAEKGGFLAMAFDPNTACEITMQPIRRFNMDAAIIFSDILTIPMALGQHLEFVTGVGPKLGPLDIDALDFNPEKLQPVYDAITTTAQQLKTENFNNTALIGFAGAPWTVATYMVEGGSSRDFLKTKTLAYQNPEVFQILMDHITDATAHYLIKQIDAGAEALQIFDSWASALDQFAFQKWCIDPIAKIIKTVRATHPDTPIIGFPKGAGTLYETFIKQTGVTAIQIDPAVSTAYARDVLQPFVPVQGNLDPIKLLAGGDIMHQSIDQILEHLADNPYIFNLGHGINKQTPITHVEDMIKRIRTT